mgnify:CR=1 FL=1
MEAKNWKTEKRDHHRCVLLNLAGVFIYAVGINSFAAPHKIAPGGASGIAILINYLTGCPIGLFVFVFNILIVGLATADNDRVEIFTGVVFINRSKGIRFFVLRPASKRGYIGFSRSCLSFLYSASYHRSPLIREL